MIVSSRTAFLSVFLAAGCSAPAVSDVGSPDPAADPPAESPSVTRQAWIVSPSEPPVPIHGFRIHDATAELSRSAEAAGCADIIVGAGPGAGPTRATLETGAELSDSFLDWVDAELGGPQASSKGVTVAVGDVNGDGVAVRCVVSVEQAHIKEAKLFVRKSGGSTEATDEARVAWEMVPEPDSLGVTAPTTTAGLLLPAVQKVREAAPPPPTTAALLLPAIQKIVDAPPPPAASSEPGYPLFDSSAPPPPFELTLSETDMRGLYPDGQRSGGPLIGLLQLRGRTTGFALKYVLHDVLVSSVKVRLTPSRALGIVKPHRAATDVPPLVGLRTAAPTTIVIPELSRVLAALDDQPSLTGDPQAAKDALVAYWTTNAGTIPSFTTGLGNFLGRAADEEGLWAYTRLETAAHVFDGLDVSDPRRPEGMSADDILTSRLLTAAASAESKDASFAMVPGPLLVLPDRAGHDYRLALSAVGRLADAAPLLVAAQPHALVGVEPDEIDVAIAATDERGPEVRSVDALAKQFLAARDAILAGGVPTAAQLEQLALHTSKLRAALASLRDVTEKRFAATR